MRQNVKNVFGALALAAFLTTALFSCSFFVSQESSEAGLAAAPTDASVSIAIDAALASEIAKNGGAEGQELLMDVTLEGIEPPKSETFAISDGCVVSFEKIPANSKIRAVATAYTEDKDSGQKKELYSGQSDWLVVKIGRNPLDLLLNQIFYVTFFANGGTWTKAAPQNVRYQKGGSLELPTSDDIAREGWLFGGWCVSEDGGTTLRPFAFTKDTSGDLALYAKWIDCAVEGISITTKRDTNDISLSYEAYDDPTEGPCVKFTATPPQSAAGGVCEFKWTVDGESEPWGGTSSTLIVKKNSLKNAGAGVYDIFVILTVKRLDASSGEEISRYYSASAQVKVE